uniref:Uncharacterized protein n=1 Tax=Cacopsylla melanoneura TaxID=428564 RepID=A0A8D9B667_9HEMI
MKPAPMTQWSLHKSYTRETRVRILVGAIICHRGLDVFGAHSNTGLANLSLHCATLTPSYLWLFKFTLMQILFNDIVALRDFHFKTRRGGGNHFSTQFGCFRGPQPRENNE